MMQMMSLPSWEDTYKFSIFVGYQDVHLWALGADDLALQRVFAQVNMATVRLVDGDGGDFTHDLVMKMKQMEVIYQSC